MTASTWSADPVFPWYLRPTHNGVLRGKTQVSDGEDCSSDPESLSNSPRSPKSLALNTALGKVGSYCYTPKGEIWLSGFQSPIPQSGLMAAATWQEEGIIEPSRASSATAVGGDGGGKRGDPSPPGSEEEGGGRVATAGGSSPAITAEGATTSAAAFGEVVTTPMIDRVVLLGRVGEGETGVVYRAFDLLDLGLVAVKVIPVNDKKKRRQLVHEVSSLYDRLGMRGRRRRRRRATIACELGETDMAVSREARQGSWGTSEDPQAGSEHILELIDVFVTKSNSTVSLVVEYMDGGSLQVRTQEYARGRERRETLYKSHGVSSFCARLSEMDYCCPWPVP